MKGRRTFVFLSISLALTANAALAQTVGTLRGRVMGDGTRLESDDAVRTWLLRSAGMAVVPFSAFGVVGDSGWFRFSVGAVSLAQIAAMLPRLRAALQAG